MRWQNRRESNNIEDRRNQSNGGFSGGGLGFIPRGKGGLVLLIIVLVAGYYGVDLTPLLGGGGQTVVQRPSTPANPAKDNEMAKFTSVILASTEDVWQTIFKEQRLNYQEPKLVLFRGATPTACGTGQSATGPFYCPPDKTVYIDLSFYQDMKNQLGADGDFAQAYVIAHEVGHHVQNLLGIADKVRSLQQQSRSQAEVNRLSVRLELQADCFAGVWGYHMNLEQALEPGDLQEALNAAKAIGDDRLQKQSRGYAVPDSFTHGTSEQRYNWFKRGFDSGKMSSCNTFDNNL